MIPWHPQVKIIKEQNDVLMAFKPCDVLSHPNKPGLCKQSLLQAPYDFSQQAYRTSDGLIYLLNRLDSPTSGLVVLCKNEALAQQIRKLFKKHEVKKIYQAIVKGRFTGKNIYWQDKLQIHKSNQHLRTYRISSSEGIAAKTIVSGLKTCCLQGEFFSLIQLEPLTGRTHQLRVQCAQHHLPILGDKTYGNFKCNRKLPTKRLCLHACSLEFSLGNQSFYGYCDSQFSDYITRVANNCSHPKDLAVQKLLGAFSPHQ